MRVERRVFLWTNILAKLSPYSLHDITATSRETAQETMHAVVPWISEAAAMRRLEIPENSFNFVIDGGPERTKSLCVVECIKRYTHWNLTYEESKNAKGVALRLTRD